MALPLLTIDVRAFGGGNWADEALSLLSRSHRFERGGWSQYAPMEASNLQNVDFVQRALAKRKGSAAIDDSSSVHASGEVIRGGFSAGGVEFLVGKKSMYRKASGGSWTIMRNAADSGSFAHDSDVTKWSVAIGDGYAFVGTDGTNNEVQVIDPSSNIVKPELKNANNYTDQKSGGTNAMTGTWPTAAYIVVWFQNRLLMSTGGNVIEYTPPAEAASSGIWDLTNGGYWLARDNIVATLPFTPRGENDLLERLFVWSKKGPQIIPGFDLSDSPLNMEGGGVPVCHRAVFPTQDWIFYVTEQGTVEGINLVRVIEVGRRGRNGDGSSGPLDNFDPSNSNHSTVTNAYYDRKKSQWLLYYPDGSSRSTTAMAFGVDMQLGEPGISEGQDGFESHTRLLWHTIKDPGTNAWFVSVYQHGKTVVGVTADGKTWTVDSGKDDLGTLAVVDYWDTPELDGGAAEYEKNWRLNTIRSEDRGNWTLDIQYALNGDPTFTDLYSFTQATGGASFVGSAIVGTSTLGDGGRAKGSTYCEVQGETIRLRFKNQRVAEDWLVGFLGQEYMMNARQL